MTQQNGTTDTIVRHDMDNYQVTFVFDYCTITARCQADQEESAPDLAWWWVHYNIDIGETEMKSAIDIIVEKLEEA